MSTRLVGLLGIAAIGGAVGGPVGALAGVIAGLAIGLRGLDPVRAPLFYSGLRISVGRFGDVFTASTDITLDYFSSDEFRTWMAPTVDRGFWESDVRHNCFRHRLSGAGRTEDEAVQALKGRIDRFRNQLEWFEFRERVTYKDRHIDIRREPFNGAYEFSITSTFYADLSALAKSRGVDIEEVQVAHWALSDADKAQGLLGARGIIDRLAGDWAPAPEPPPSQRIDKVKVKPSASKALPAGVKLLPGGKGRSEGVA
jgi:hypothetical protein